MKKIADVLSQRILGKMKANNWELAVSMSGEADGFCNFVARADGQIFVENGSYCSQQGYSCLNKLDASELGQAFDHLEPLAEMTLGADAAWLAGGAAPSSPFLRPPLADRQENLADARAQVRARGGERIVLPELIEVSIPTTGGVAKMSFKGGTSAWKAFWTFETREAVAVQHGNASATIPAGAEVFGFMNGVVSEPGRPGASYAIPLDRLTLASDELSVLADDILSKGINKGETPAWEALLDQARKAKMESARHKAPSPKP